MERKNTMLLTVIAVATLLVAVVGATFAYYSVTSGTDTSSTALTTTTQKVGTVTLTNKQENLYLNVTAEQMSLLNKNKSWYSTTTAGDALAEANKVTDTVLAEFKLTGADAGDKYECVFNWSLKTASESVNAANVKAEDGSVTLAMGSGLYGLPANTSLKDTLTTNGVSGTGKVQFTGATQLANVTGYAQWNNLDENQNLRADLDMTTTLKIDLVSCDTVSSFSANS